MAAITICSDLEPQKIKGGVICTSEAIDVAPSNLDSSCASSSPAFLMMYSAYKLNKQGDNIQPWVLLFLFGTSLLFMSSYICCFLTCIQVSQEAGQVVWYFHFFQNFPQFIIIHTVKGFGIVNKTEIDVFLELSCFFNDPAMLAIWSLVPLPFLKPAWTSASSQFTYCWSLAWRILSITLLALWDECNCARAVVWALFEIAFLWDWNENWPFPVL